MTRRNILAGAIFAAGFWAALLAFIIWDQDHSKNRRARHA